MDVMGLAAEFGLRNGISFPLHGVAGENGILSWMSNYIFEAAIRVVRFSMMDSVGKEPLTERETECLFWASEGKTSSEITCILGMHGAHGQLLSQSGYTQNRLHEPLSGHCQRG